MNNNTPSWLLIARFAVIVLIGLLAISVNYIEASSSVFPFGVTIDNPEKTYKGFTLYTPLGGKTGEGENNKVYLINMKGNRLLLATVYKGRIVTDQTI